MPRPEGGAVLALLAALVAGCGGGESPRLKASGLPATAAVGGVTELRVQLRNIGGRTLALDGIGRVCGCTATSRLPAELVAGASTMLDLRCRAPRTLDAVRREIVIRSSDPHEPATVLSEPLPGIGPGPVPAAVYFGYVAVGASAVRDVVLPHAIALDAAARPADPALELEPMPGRPDGASGVRVRFSPSRPGIVRVTLDLGAAGGSLPVVAVGYAGLLAAPSEVHLTAANAALPAIMVVGTGGSPVPVRRIEYPYGIEGTVRTIVPWQQYRLVLRGRASGAGEIRLFGDDGPTPILTIPIVVGAPAT